MSKMKKVLLMCTAYVLVVALAIGGTLAYLTSTDSDVNVMTLGNVSIEQIEQERDANGNLVDFTQGKPALPAVGSPAWDDVLLEVNGGNFKMFDNDKFKNTVDKIVSVKNTGKSDAYFRTIIAIEDPFTTGRVGVNVGADAYIGSPWYTVEIDGVTYSVKAYTYKEILEPGEASLPSLLQAYLNSDTTNEDCALLGDTWDILALSQAVQADGFDDADTALNEAFGDVNALNIAEWFGGKGEVHYVEAGSKKADISGEAAEEALAALTAGQYLKLDKDVDILELDTNEVDAKGAIAELNGVGPEAYGYLAFLPAAGEDVTVSNLNVTGSGFVEIGHYGMGGGTYTVNNVKIENLAATLKNENKGFYLGCAFMGMGDVTLNDCVMTGTTAVQDGVIPVDLGCGQAWSGYKDGNDNKISTTINGGEYGTVYCWSHALVTVNGAEVDTMYAAPISGTVTIKAGTHVGTINVDYGTSASYATASNLAKLVIEDGATVDAIVHNGTTYTVAQWNAYVASL